MNPSRKAVVFDLVFGSKETFYRFSQEAEGDPSLSVTFVRGSIGKDGAWARVQLRGERSSVDRLVRRWNDAIVAFARLPQTAA